jgi:hypothetical protein
MNTDGWSAERLEGLREIHRSLRWGAGWLAAEGVLILTDVTDAAPVPLAAHAIVGFVGTCVTGSDLLALRDLRNSSPEPFDVLIQVE